MFQDGNHFAMKIDGDIQITVDYRFGQGERTRVAPSPDGEIKIDPPTKLRIDYTYNGTQACRIAELGDTLEINDRNAKPPDIALLLGRWSANWSDAVEDIEIAQVDGNPAVTIDGYDVSDVKFDCGRLTFKRVYRKSGWRFVETITRVSNQLEFRLHSLNGAKVFTGALLKK